jgi:hypothetical protein
MPLSSSQISQEVTRQWTRFLGRKLFPNSVSYGTAISSASSHINYPVEVHLTVIILLFILFIKKNHIIFVQYFKDEQPILGRIKYEIKCYGWGNSMNGS